MNNFKKKKKKDGINFLSYLLFLMSLARNVSSSAEICFTSFKNKFLRRMSYEEPRK